MELMVTLAVLAVIISLAVPSFKEAIERRHLEGAASSIHLGLQRAKSEAVKQNKPILFEFNAATWCYGINDTDDGGGGVASCDCTAGTCTLNGQAVAVAGSEFDNVTGTGSDVEFDGTVGLPDPSATTIFTVTLNGKTKTIDVNAAGLIRSY
jgi:type IV fimbrial biogenesis protein FimT